MDMTESFAKVNLKEGSFLKCEESSFRYTSTLDRLKNILMSGGL